MNYFLGGSWMVARSNAKELDHDTLWKGIIIAFVGEAVGRRGTLWVAVARPIRMDLLL